LSAEFKECTFVQLVIKTQIEEITNAYRILFGDPEGTVPFPEI